MSNVKKIRVAIAGVGSCASSLVQGIEWYIQNQKETIGLMYEDIGGYKVTDMEFVVGFDVDNRKIDTLLEKAIFAKPNCSMLVVNDVSNSVEKGARVYPGPILDGVAPHMLDYPEEVSFSPYNPDTVSPISADEYQELLKQLKVDVLLNYMPVGSEEASAFYIENAILAGICIINCMPSYISTEASKRLESLAINHEVTIVGSDMRSAFGASRLSEVLQGSMLDSGLMVTQHIQENKSCNTTQGQEHIRNGRTAGPDFLNMANQERLHSKHVSKEAVLNGQSVIRDKSIAGMTMYAGPSLTVIQKPGGTYIGSDNKVAVLDIVAYGWAGARYELFARMSVQDSPNSASIVADAIRFCKVAREEGVIGYLRGPSAWSQKSPPVQMKTNDAKFECDALARRIITPMVEKQLIGNKPQVDDLDWTFQSNKTDYE